MPIEIRYDPDIGLVGQAAIAAASGAGGRYGRGASTGEEFLSTMAAQFGALARAREEANMRKQLASMELQRDLMRYEYGERAAAREADLRMRLAQMGFERQRQLAELEARRQIQAQAAAQRFQAERDRWLEAMAQLREEREAQRRNAAAELGASLRERAAESDFLRDIARMEYEDKLRARRQAESDERRYEYETQLRQAALAEQQIKEQQAWEKASLDAAEDTVAGIVKQLTNENLTPEGRQLYSKLLGELRMIQSERMRLRPRQYYDALVQWIKKVDDSRLDAYRVDELPIEQQFQSSAIPAENGTGFFVKNRSGWRFFNTQPRLGASQALAGAAASRGARPQISIDQYMRLRQLVEERLRLQNVDKDRPLQPTDEEVDAELRKLLKHYMDLTGPQYGPAPGQTPIPPEAAGTPEEELQRLQQVEESRRGPDAEALQGAQERVEVFASPEVESKLKQLLQGAADQAEGKVTPKTTVKRKLTPEQFDARKQLVTMLDNLQKDIKEGRDPFPDEQTRNFVVQELEGLTQRAKLTPEEDKMVRGSLGYIGQVLASQKDAKIAQELGEGRRLAALRYLQYLRRKYNGSAEEFNKRASLWEKGRLIWALHVLTEENQ